MILYLDASAHVKQYVRESGSELVEQVIADASLVGTALIDRAEVEAALAKYVRMGIFPEASAQKRLAEFRSDWLHLVKLPITHDLVEYAGQLTWSHGLRGYDAVHLATALTWQDRLREQITMATFDRRLWQIAQASELAIFPTDLTPFVKPK